MRLPMQMVEKEGSWDPSVRAELHGAREGVAEARSARTGRACRARHLMYLNFSSPRDAGRLSASHSGESESVSARASASAAGAKGRAARGAPRRTAVRSRRRVEPNPPAADTAAVREAWTLTARAHASTTSACRKWSSWSALAGPGEPALDEETSSCRPGDVKSQRPTFPARPDPWSKTRGFRTPPIIPHVALERQCLVSPFHSFLNRRPL